MPYGPPPDPRQLTVDLSLAADPTGHAVCLGIAALAAALAWWSSRKQLPQIAACWAIFAVVIAFTTPWLYHLDHLWFGDFPTIDKEGSLLFYLDGVHRRLYAAPLAAPDDAAVRLIGVHAGHLWLTAAFDTVLSPMGAFNAQALLQAALGWGCASWLVAEVLAVNHDNTHTDVVLPWWAVLAAGFDFGMGLHVFRDLNWTTIEKGGVFWLALFAVALLRAARHGGRYTLAPAAVYLPMALYNLYFAIVAAFMGALALAGCLTRPTLRRRLALAALGCTAVGVPVAAAQLAIQAGGPALATPERFLWERAGLDGFSVWPLRWNRLEVWRACNPVAACLAVVGLAQARKQWWLIPTLASAALLFIVSIGPVVVPGDAPDAPRLTNPVYLALHHAVPGFWRLAKPEVFFEPVWLLGLVFAGLGLAHLYKRSPVSTKFAALGILVVWWPLVRLHPAFPGTSQPIDSALDADWKQRVFGPPTKPRR